MKERAKPRLSVINSLAWLVVGVLAIGILLPAPPTPRGPAVAASAQQPPRAIVTPASLVIGPIAQPDLGAERLNALVWRRGKRPEHQSVATLPLAHQGGSVLDKSLGIPATDAGTFATQPAQFKSPTHMVATTAVNVHSLPGSAVKLFPLKQGDRVEVISTQGLWTEIQGPAGPSGWVYSSFLIPDPA